MECDFIPISYDSFDYEDENYIEIVGRTEKGKQICVVDKYEPSFWIILKEADRKEIDSLIKKIKEIKLEKNTRNIEVTKVELHDKKFLEKDVKALKVFTKNYKDLHDIASEIGDDKIILHRREYDINIITKYLMETDFEPLKYYKIEYSPISNEDLGGIVNIFDCDVVSLKKKKETQQHEFKPKVLAYDIETENVEIGKSPILMISLYSENFKKVLTCNNSAKLDFVDTFKAESDMLDAFVKNVKDFDPDILCGYFSDGFDLPYIKSRADKNKINFNLGIDNSRPILSKGRIPAGKINGIAHIDIYRFVSSIFSQYLQTESLSLNEVAKELIGEQKKEFDFHKLSNMTNKDWKNFYEYNLQDSKITYNLFHAIWIDMKELTSVIKEPLFNISRNTMATNCENYILHNLKRFNEIAEKKPTTNIIADRISNGKYEGAFVFEPKPNLYEKIVFFDFTSMYGSIIVTFNLGKSTFNGTDFDKTPKGFFPILLEEIITKRKKYKKEYNQNKNNLTKARSNAYKLLANASYGYLGFAGARYYSRESAQATTKNAKDKILATIDAIKKEGYEIIYSDTDSIAFTQGTKTKKEIMDLLKRLNDNLPGIMELDFEDFYKRGIFVSKRDGEKGAKKKYALLKEDDTLKIRGFETIRRDWCQAARDLQRDILHSILLDGNATAAEKIFTTAVNKLKNREVDKKDLLMKVQLKKEILEYSSMSPHVIAAKKMQDAGINVSSGMVVEYYVGGTGKSSKKVGDKVFLIDENIGYDIDYYLNNQYVPAVENIFEVLSIDIRKKVNKQKSLFDYET